MNSVKSAISSLTDQFTTPKNSPRDKKTEVSPLTPNTPIEGNIIIPKIAPPLFDPPPPIDPPPSTMRPMQQYQPQQYQPSTMRPMQQYQSQQYQPSTMRPMQQYQSQKYQPPPPTGKRPINDRPFQRRGGKTRKRKIKKRKTFKRKDKKRGGSNSNTTIAAEPEPLPEVKMTMEQRNYNVNELQPGRKYTFIIRKEDEGNDVFEGRVRSVVDWWPNPPLKSVYLYDLRINGISSAPIELGSNSIVSITGMVPKVFSIKNKYDPAYEINQYLGLEEESLRGLGGRKTKKRKRRKSIKNKKLRR